MLEDSHVMRLSVVSVGLNAARVTRETNTLLAWVRHTARPACHEKITYAVANVIAVNHTADGH